MKSYDNPHCPQAPCAWGQWSFASTDSRQGVRLSAHWKILARNFGQIRQTTYRDTRTVNVSPTKPAEVLPRVAAGESRAMNLCIDQYGALVWSIARRYIKDPSQAEDLVQEVFTEIWKKAGSFDPAIASESTFIGLVARRRAIDFLRREGRKPGFEQLSAAESVPLPNDGHASPDCDPEAIQSSLQTLPSETRTLFRLFFEDGFTHPEISEKTGIPLGTVKTRLRRGLIALRDQLSRGGISNQPSAS